MIKRRVKLIIFLCFAVVCFTGYIVLKCTERSRIAIQAFETLINVPETGLEANEKQLEKIIKYADKQIKSIIYYKPLTICESYVFN
jgi:hypothetical protein